MKCFSEIFPKAFLRYETIGLWNLCNRSNTTASMMTSPNGIIFRVTGLLCGEFTGRKGQWRRALMFSLICAWIKCWVNNREAGDLRRHCDHYDVIVMSVPLKQPWRVWVDISLKSIWSGYMTTTKQTKTWCVFIDRYDGWCWLASKVGSGGYDEKSTCWL